MTESTEVIGFDLKHKAAIAVSIDDFLKDALATDKIYWVHCDLANKEPLSAILQKLQVDEELHDYIKDGSAISRMNESENALSLKLQVPVQFDPLKITRTRFTTMLVYMTNQVCLTLSYEPVPAIRAFKQTYLRSLRYALSPCFILFLLFDNVLNQLAEMIFALETLTDEMDHKIRTSHQNYYRKVTRIKYQALKTTRFASAMRDILMRISGRKIAVINEVCRKSLTDLFNHAHVIVNEGESVHEVLNGLLSQIDNALIHRMSEAMKVLTGIATIFLPLTLITGIYGMNFRHMPELDWQYGYFGVVTMIVILGIAMFVYFRIKKWM